MSVKETTDILYLTKVVVLNVVREIAKDGFQIADLGAFLKSAEFEKALGDAVTGADQVIGEVSNLSLMDDLAIARYVYNMAMDIVQEVKAAKKA